MIFPIVYAAMLAERGFEVLLARRHVARLVARGARRVPRDLYAPIVLAQAAMFGLLAVEWRLAPWADVGPWTWGMLVALVLAQALRYSAIATLGDRWTTRLYVVPGLAPVARGPYRWLGHPNYVAVMLETLAFPLAFGCMATAVVAFGAHAALLSRRIVIEERALAEAAAGR